MYIDTPDDEGAEHDRPPWGYSSGTCSLLGEAFGGSTRGDLRIASREQA
jgi:hypothetical protein